MPVSRTLVHELAAEMIARGEADEPTVRRFVRWAEGLEGITVARDGAEIVLTWREARTWGATDGERREVRAVSLAVAMDEIERMPR